MLRTLQLFQLRHSRKTGDSVRYLMQAEEMEHTPMETPQIPTSGDGLTW